MSPILRRGGIAPLWYSLAHMGADSVGQGTWQYANNYDLGTTARHNFDFDNATTHADGDNYTHNVYLPAGTYTFRLDYFQGPNKPIVKLYVDNDYIDSVDCYGAGDNYTYKDFANIAIGHGKHAIKLAVDGKNASSSDYQCRFYGGIWIPTGTTVGNSISPVEMEDCVSPITIIPSITVTATAVAGTWYNSMATNSNFLYGTRPWLSSTMADGDAWTVPFMAAPGTYTFRIFLAKSNNAGIVDVFVDDMVTKKFSVDMYAAGTSYTMVKQAGVTISGGFRRHLLKIACNGKNASSSAYVIHNFCSILLKRTA